jgi:hypothetical protein
MARSKKRAEQHPEFQAAAYYEAARAVMAYRYGSWVGDRGIRCSERKVERFARQAWGELRPGLRESGYPPKELARIALHEASIGLAGTMAEVIYRRRRGERERLRPWEERVEEFEVTWDEIEMAAVSWEQAKKEADAWGEVDFEHDPRYFMTVTLTDDWGVWLSLSLLYDADDVRRLIPALARRISRLLRYEKTWKAVETLAEALIAAKGRLAAKQANQILERIRPPQEDRDQAFEILEQMRIESLKDDSEATP